MTIAQTLTTVELDHVLRRMADRARAAYPGEAQRIDRGLVIALNGGVTLHQDGTASVHSASDREVVYHVANGHCDCPDHQRATDGRCKHRFAVCLVKKARKEIAQQAAIRTYHATWTHQGDAPRYGFATLTTATGWLFQCEETGKVWAAMAHELDLHGNVAVLATA